MKNSRRNIVAVSYFEIDTRVRISFIVFRVMYSLCIKRYLSVTSVCCHGGGKEGVWPEASNPLDAEVVLDE